ncbi:MAG TPA: hypothetical protein VFD58_05720 [Blastocatellia bacterium]|nr:hypothetical protein [Blastocatellia bacterium]
MSNLDDAREGLKYIMKRYEATLWRENGDSAYVISVPYGTKKVKYREYLVPKKNVEEAEKDLENNTLPMKWVYQLIVQL